LAYHLHRCFSVEHHRLNEDSRSQLRFEQPDGVTVYFEECFTERVIFQLGWRLGDWKRVECAGNASGETIKRLEDSPLAGTSASIVDLEIYAESFEGESHLHLIIREAQEMVSNTLGQS
jgi:hypothetical protein